MLCRLVKISLHSIVSLLSSLIRFSINSLSSGLYVIEDREINASLMRTPGLERGSHDAVGGGGRVRHR